MIRTVFMGSSAFACPCLDALLSFPEALVVAVVTQPDRQKGRGLEQMPCEVKAHIRNREIPILTPTNVNEAADVACIRDLAPDLLVIVAYGQILKQPLLAVPPMGCVNVHASLLPKYRGAAPIQWAIANGERETGVTTMLINQEVDAGGILMQRVVPISDDDTGGILEAKLAKAGAELLIETLSEYGSGRLKPTPQNEGNATRAPKLRKTDGRVNWNLPAREIVNRLRAFTPWPGCTCEVPRSSGRLVRVVEARVEDGDGQAAGEVIETSGAGPLVKAGKQAVRLIQVQPSGGKPMSGAAFLRGRPLAPGIHLG